MGRLAMLLEGTSRKKLQIQPKEELGVAGWQGEAVLWEMNRGGIGDEKEAALVSSTKQQPNKAFTPFGGRDPEIES
jgi:hypothetical protein